MACNCNDNKTNCYNISMGCVVPALANPNAYYTKSEIDEKLEDIVISGGVTSGEVQSMIDASIPTNVSAFVNDVPYLTEHQSLSGYATQQWVTDQGYLTEHQSLEGYATEQWVQNQHYITGVDLSDYATKEYVSGYTYDKETIDEKVAGGGSFDPTQYYTTSQTDNLLSLKLDASAYTPTDLSNYYNKQEVDSLINSISSDVTQYFTNLQQQINSLIQTISGCCVSSGETQYRWIIMTGENDYWCDGTVKKSLEKQQSSTDGLNWSDTGVIRSGSTVLEYDSSSCGYDINSGLKITLANGNVISYDCEDLETVTCSGVTKYKLTHNMVMSAITSPNDVKKLEIGTCVDLIGADAFSGLTNLQKVVIPSSFKSESIKQCDGIDVNAFERTAIRTVGLQGSGADVEWNDNMEDMASEMFKGCTSLVSVDLHNGFKTFDPYVFSGCTNLQSITIRSNNIPVLNSWAQSGYPYDALDGIGNNTFVIYVPSDMVDAYKNSVDHTGYKNWSKYADRIFPIQ